MASTKDGAGDKQTQSIPKQRKKLAQNGTNSPSVSSSWVSYKERVKSLALGNWALLTEPSSCSWWPFPAFLLLVEMVMNLVIIEKVNYTEIDWKAYMQVKYRKSSRIRRPPKH